MDTYKKKFQCLSSTSNARKPHFFKFMIRKFYDELSIYQISMNGCIISYLCSRDFIFNLDDMRIH